MRNFKSFHFTVAAAAAMGLSLTACGDDVTEVTEVHKDGMAVLEKGEDLSEQACDTTNVGEMLFVMDSSEAFICDGESWQTLKGEKGETGADGKDGSDGTDGTSCTVKSVKNKDDLNGLEVTCGKTVVDTIWNGVDGKDGKPGNPGKAGENGTGCTAKSVENDAGLKGFELTCGETVVGTIWDGQKGGDGEKGNDGVGCSLTDDGKGSVAVTCGDEDPVTIYKAVCGTKPYDPETQYCSEGNLYGVCGTKQYDPGKAFCSEGELFSCNDKPYDPKKQYCKLSTTVVDYGWLTDSRDKLVYKTVEIGGQVWMAENLNYNVSATSYCYGGESDNCDTYGRLYTWEVAMDNADCTNGKTCNASLDPETPVRGVCPDGWHLPSFREFETLINYIDSDFGYLEYGRTDDAKSTIVPQYLKSWIGWNGTDGYGFSALPGGRRDDNGIFDYAGSVAVFWSSGEYDADNAYYLHLGNDDVSIDWYYGKFFARSVRCIKD